jgi:Kef-type K+ transport system membrane component KefB
MISGFVGLLAFHTLNAFASGGPTPEGHTSAATLFLWIAILLILAKLSSLVEKLGQPAVLGELIIGVILGNLGFLGLHYFDAFKSNEILKFLAELGVVILLFQIGLESNIDKMRKVGLRALLVAAVGVVLPFVLGTWVVGPWFFADSSFNTHLFIGATLTATSVGITARVFQDLKKLQTPEAQIVLGAAVIDDILGLIILAVVSQMASTGDASLLDIGWITLKAMLFLGGAIASGRLLVHPMNRFFSKVHTGVGMKFTAAICFGLLFAFLAQAIGLAPIVGAFAGGLVLDPVHFRYFKDPKIVSDIKILIKDEREDLRHRFQDIMNHHAERHIEDIIQPISLFFVPLFFVITGMGVNLATLFDTSILGIALVITIIAFVGKIAAGLVAGKVNKSLVGWGMVPRGEVGLIFATIGKGLGVVSDELFSVFVILIILTTLLPPPILAYLIRKADRKALATASH